MENIPQTLFVIANLFLLEVLLSLDNAAVLAVIVKDLPEDDRPKALRYGLIGAFAFRGLSLFIASWLVGIFWIKIAGGLYLAYLTYSYFTKKEVGEEGYQKEGKIANLVKNTIGLFWGTVLILEVSDIIFALDNILAAVAFTDNIYLILLGVFIGIVAMRFVAQKFTVLLETYPSLEKTAFIVIGLLGIKLVLSGVLGYMEASKFKEILDSHEMDLFFSLVMLVIFSTPVIKTHFKKQTVNG